MEIQEGIDDTRIPQKPIDIPDAKIPLAKVSERRCLSLAKLSDLLNRESFIVPSVAVVTDVRLNADADDRDTRFYSNSLFGSRRGPMNQMFPFRGVIQKDCSKVLLTSASGLSLRYKVDESSARHISISFAEIVDSDLSDLQKSTFASRAQPSSYDIFFLSETSVKVTSKYKTFEPICNKKRLVEIEKTETISWGNELADLPITVAMEKKFLDNFDKSLAVPYNLGKLSDLPLTLVEQMQKTPMMEDLKVCPIK